MPVTGSNNIFHGWLGSLHMDRSATAMYSNKKLENKTKFFELKSKGYRHDIKIKETRV